MRKKITLLTFLFSFIFFSLMAQNSNEIKLFKKNSQIYGLKTNPVLSGKYLSISAKGPVSEDFELSFPPYGWYLQTGTGDWDQSNQSEDHTSGSGLFARYNCYNINGTDDASIVSPAMSITSVDKTFSFWVNYYLIDGDYGQGAELYVDVSGDFGQSWNESSENIISGEHGVGWFQKIIDLSSYNGVDYTGNNVVLRFRAVSDYGSYNIAIDDVNGPELYIADDDAGIVSIENPQGTILSGNHYIKTVLQNFGNNDLTSVDINYSVRDTINNSEISNDVFNWTGTITTSNTEIVNLVNYNFANAGVYNIISSTSSPNGQNDLVTTNNESENLITVIDPGQLYEEFESDVFPPDSWLVDDNGWEIVDANYVINGNQSVWIPQKNGDPAKKIITPAITIQASSDYDLVFLLGGLNNDAGAAQNLGYSTLEVKYASNPDGTWTSLETFDMGTEGDDAQYKSVDLSSLSAGDYYFAFEATSTFDYQTYSSMVIIDDVMAAIKADAVNNDLAVEKVIYPKDFVFSGISTEIDVVIKNVGINVQNGNTVTVYADASEIGTATIGELNYSETDTVSIMWTASEESGIHDISASLADDDNNSNNSNTVSGIVVNEGMLVEGFETVEFYNNWEIEEGWSKTNATSGAFAQYSGDSALICNGNVSGGAYSDVKAISPVMNNDGTLSEMYFYGKRVNSTDISETTIQLKYTDDINGGNWFNIGPSLELNDNWEMYIVDLSSVPYGDYYFAFSASSTYDNADYNGYALIDNVVGIYYPAPDVHTLSPNDEATTVALDSEISIKYAEDITVNDLSGITISGTTEGDVGNVVASLDVDNRTLIISHDAFVNNYEVYTVTIPDGSVKNANLVGNKEKSWSFTTIMDNPEGNVYTPVINSEGIPLNTDISLKFNQKLTEIDFSNITVIGDVEGAVGNVNAVLVNDYTVQIEHDILANNNEVYTVTIPAGAVKNIDNVENEIVSWSFTSLLVGQPVADTLAPSNNSTGVELNSDVYIVFDQNITETDLSGISILGESEGVVGNIVPVLVNDTLFIAHDDFANNNELYTVTIPAAAVNASGVDNAEIIWTFRTELASPVPINFQPTSEEIGVSLDADIFVEFDQDINYNDFSGITITGATQGEVGGVNAYFGGDRRMIITHHEFENYNEEYTVNVLENTILNDEGVGNNAFSWTFTTIAQQNVNFVVSDGESLVGGAQVIFKDDTLYTDGAGETVFKTIPDVAMPYRINKTGYIESAGLITITDHDTTVNVNFEILKYNIQFSVTDGDDYIDSAKVIFNNDTIICDTLGVAIFTDVPYGLEKEYSVSKENYEIYNGTIDVDASKIEDIVLSLLSYNVTFMVSEGSTAIENAQVIFNSDTLNTDNSGSAIFENVLSEENIAYIVTKENYEDVTGNLTVIDSDVTEIVSLTAVGIVDFNNSKISVYPNPSNGVIIVDGLKTANSKICIYDISGKCIFNMKVTSTKENIRLEGNKSGMYILEYTNNDRIVRTKILVK